MVQRNDITRRLVIEHYNREAVAYDASRTDSPSGRRLTRFESRWLTRHLPGQPGARILEMGCGTGRLLLRLNLEGVQLIGLDPSRAMLCKLRDNATSNRKDIELVQGTGESLPFQSESFDSVYTVNVVHWLAEPRLAIKDMYRIVKAGGTLLVDFPNARSFVALLSRLLRRKSGAWHTYTVREIGCIARDVAGSRNAELLVQYSWSPALWKLPIVGRWMPWIEKYIPAPRRFAHKYVCKMYK